MAGLDYITCINCDDRIIYHPENNAKISCLKCYNKLVKKINKLKRRIKK